MEWQQRLYNHEETPPAGVWNALANQLRPDAGRLAERLEGNEVEPPADAWPSIAAALSGAPNQRKGMLRRLYPYLIPAAAACLTIFCFQYFSISIPIENGQTAAAAALPPNNPTVKEPLHSRQEAQVPLAASTATLEHETKNIAMPMKGPAPKNVAGTYQDANYIEVCDATRSSCSRINYKLQGMAECLHTKSSAMATDPCGRELQHWTEQMEHSTYVPAPGHFFDIIELAVSLQVER